MVTKVEKINCMRTRLKPLSFFNWQSAGKPRIEETSTTIPSAHENEQQKYDHKHMVVGEIPLIGSGVHPIGMKIWSIHNRKIVGRKPN